MRGATITRSTTKRIRINFNPRAPCGARHESCKIIVFALLDFNPRAPCGARHSTETKERNREKISTHAPLAGRDTETVHKSGYTSISTHAPLAGRDDTCNHQNNENKKFQPTRPLRGATPNSVSLALSYSFQPTRPLRGATRDEGGDGGKTLISTHAPLAGRDSKSVQITMHIFAITDKFQMLLHRMPPVRAFCSFLMQENHADFGCEPPK